MLSKGTETLKAQLYNKPVLLDTTFNDAEYTIHGVIDPDFLAAACFAAQAVYGGDFAGASKPFPFSQGVAVIPVTGMLLNRFPYAFSFATGYNAISSMLDAALADPDVKGIAFDVNSPGGMVQGCFELCDQIFEARSQKPMAAMVDGSATSAAYAIASSAGNVSAPRSSRVGSVGVVMMHADLSAALDQAGVKVTYVYAGDHKIDGSPYKPLTKEMKADFQKSVDASYEEFVATVARNRGIDAQVVRDTEAQVYNAADAKDLGLIDEVAAPSDAFTKFASELSGSSFNSGVSNMTVKTEPGASEAAAPDVKAIEAAAATAAKTRISAILALPEAVEKTGLAQHLALNTDLSVDAAKGVLAASPATVKVDAAKTNALQDAMAKTDNPNVAAGGAAKTEETALDRILGNYSKASGVDVKAKR